MSLSYAGEATFERSHDLPIIHSSRFPLAFWITKCFLCSIFLFCYELLKHSWFALRRQLLIPHYRTFRSLWKCLHAWYVVLLDWWTQHFTVENFQCICKKCFLIMHLLVARCGDLCYLRLCFFCFPTCVWRQGPSQRQPQLKTLLLDTATVCSWRE